jgi:hypothetical protein
MSVTFKIGTTDVTPSYSTINPISGTSNNASSDSWKYYLYYPSSSSETTLTIGYSSGSTGGYMCIQSAGGSGGSTTNSVYGGGGGGGQVYVKSLGVSSDLSITIYGMGNEKDTTVTDTTSGYISIGAGKNGTNGTTGACGDGGDGGNYNSNCIGGGGGNAGSNPGSNPFNEINLGSGKPGNGYYGGTTGSFGDSVPGYVSVDFEDGTKANLGSGGKQGIAGNTSFVMVYYPI